MASSVASAAEASVVGAAAAGNWELVRQLLRAGCSPSDSDALGSTALYYVCTRCNSSDPERDNLIRLLVKHGASVNQPCYSPSLGRKNKSKQWSGATPLAFAADTALMRVLLEASADVNACTAFGHSVLMLQVLGGRKQHVALLIEAGANVNAKAQNLQTALLLTASLPKGRLDATDIMRYLIEAGADVNAINRNGQSALHFAAICGRPDCIAILAQAGADLNLYDRDGMTPLMRAAQVSLPATKALLHAGAAVKAVDRPDGIAFVSKKDALVYALHPPWPGSAEVALCLVRAGSSVNGSTSVDVTPLMMAAREGHMSLLTALLEAGACLDTSNYEGMSALIYAIMFGHPGAVDLLLQRGASLVPSKEGISPLLVACTHVFHVDASIQLYCVQAILNASANVNDKYGHIALIAAAIDNRHDIVAALIAAGASPCPPGVDPGPDSLARCLCDSDIHIVHQLIDAGANVNVSGSLAMVLAAHNGLKERIGDLLELGCALPEGDMADFGFALRNWKPGSIRSKETRWRRREAAISHWQLATLDWSMSS
jgi:ankyrin repeat protein